MALFPFMKDPRKRRLFRVAGAWAVAGWIAVEVTATVAPLLGLPDWIPTAVVLAVLIGFPLVVVLAWAFEMTPEGIRRSRPAPGGTSVRQLAPVGVLVGGAAMLAAGTAWWVLGSPAAPDSPPAAASDRVAVVPFRVSGPERIEYLSEGMMDLLAAKLGGDEGPHAVDPGTLMGETGSWDARVRQGIPQDSLLALGGRVGAASILSGSVVGSPENLIVSATLLDASTGREMGRASVEGPEAELQSLTDRLAAGVLALEAGEEEQRLATLTTRSLPALRRYLLGRSALRRGDFGPAERHFLQALEADSTFALAAIGGYHASSFTPTRRPELLERAWRFRDRLAQRDLALLSALLGPDHPEASIVRASIRAWERAAELLPDQVDVVYNLADDLLHFGRVARIADAWERAAAHFDRSLALDSTYASALGHRISLALAEDDPELVARLADRFLEEAPDADQAVFVRWARLVAAGDTVALRGFWSEVGDHSHLGLLYIAGDGTYSRAAAAHAWPAMVEIVNRSGVGAERAFELFAAYRTALNYGKPARAAEWLAEAVRTDPEARPDAWTLTLLGSLHGGDDPERAAEVAARAERALSVGEDTEGVETNEGLRCALGHWRLVQGDGPTEEVLGRYGERPEEESSGDDDHVRRVCGALLEAVAAVRSGASDARQRVATLDARLADGPPMSNTSRDAANLTLAGLWRELGEPQLAYEAARARSVGVPDATFTAEFLRLEADLAAELGRRDDAVRALRHYLAYRSSPEPSVRPDVEEARALLRELTDGG